MDPPIEAFIPAKVYTEESQVELTDLAQLIAEAEVSDAILVYRLLQKNSIEVPADGQAVVLRADLLLQLRRSAQRGSDRGALVYPERQGKGATAEDVEGSRSGRPAFRRDRAEGLASLFDHHSGHVQALPGREGLGALPRRHQSQRRTRRRSLQLDPQRNELPQGERRAAMGSDVRDPRTDEEHAGRPQPGNDELLSAHDQHDGRTKSEELRAEDSQRVQGARR